MISIIDADALVYRAGFASQKEQLVVTSSDGTEQVFPNNTELRKWVLEDTSRTDYTVQAKLVVEPPENAIQILNTIIKYQLTDKLNTPCEFYLTGKDNFRHEIATIQPYKGNRDPFAKPRHYQLLRDYLVSRFNAQIVNGIEADDAVAIRATELGKEAIIVSNDKDLDMVPGIHYNWVKGERYEITERQGYINFYRQFLTGDRTDHIPGLPGVGEVKAERLIAGCTKPESLWGAVYRAYFDHYGHRYDDNHTLTEALLEIGRLLWIKRSRDEPLWTYPS